LFFLSIRYHFVTLCFQGEAVGQESRSSVEVTRAGYYSRSEIGQMDVIRAQCAQVEDAFAGQAAAFLR
jgi:hypothetical protein